MDEIIRTNRELRKQLAEDDELISKYETRIKGRGNHVPIYMWIGGSKI